MADNLNERFGVTPQIVAMGTTQYSEADAAEEYFTNLSLNIPMRPPAGLAYRLTIAGTRATGTNGTLTIKIYLNTTAVLSLAADTNANGDWICKAIIIFEDPKAQKCCGSMFHTSADATHDYAAGTVDCSAGATLKASMTQGHADDTCTCEMWVVERWQQDLTA